MMEVSMSPYYKCKCEKTRRYRGNRGRSAGLFPCIRCVHCGSGLGQIPNTVDGVRQEPLDYPEPDPHPLVVEILVDQHGQRQEYRECAYCDFREPLTEKIWRELFHRRKTKRIRDLEITAIHLVLIAIGFGVGLLVAIM